MKKLNCIFGPIPSRRLGRSLGVSPIPNKTCNYSCIYCQLGKTTHMTNSKKEFFPVEQIIKEFKEYIKNSDAFDIVTIVGEGEPTLYLKLKELILEIKKICDKPVAVITNGSLLTDKDVYDALLNADIVLPSIDAYNEEIYKKIDRPYGYLNFTDELKALERFSKEYKGKLWLEIMLVKGVNSSKKDIDNFLGLLKNIIYDIIYINTPVRPPAESYVEVTTDEEIDYAVKVLNGISIDKLTSGNFFSEIEDNYQAILNIIKRHPMNQFEIESFLTSRNEKDILGVFKKLQEDNNVNHIDYKGITTYRIK